MNNTKPLFLLIVFVVLLSAVSCNFTQKGPSFPSSSSSMSQSSASSQPVVKRDAGKEYRSVSERTYYDVDSALSAVDSYITSFNNDDEAWEYVENMKEIRKELKDMNRFFNRSYYSCRQYVDAAQEVASQFKNSEWSIVRTVWNKEYNSKYDALLREAMDDIDADSFRSYMIKDAEKRCLENYESNGPLGIGYMLSRTRSTEVISISNPQELDGKSGKKTEGVFRVHMEGSLGMGHRVGTVKIRIKGELGITTSGDLQYHPLDYDIIERTGSLQ